MSQEYKPGEIVPQSGVYQITHDPAHADMPHEESAATSKTRVGGISQNRTRP